MQNRSPRSVLRSSRSMESPLRRPRAASLAAMVALAAPALAGLALWPAETLATTVVPTTIEELAQRSDLVVLAEVRDARAQWMNGHIVTDHRLSVRVVGRGPSTVRASSELLVRMPGGVVGRIGQQVPGVPAVEVGRTYAWFLQRAPERDGALYYLTHLTAAVLPLGSGPDGVVRVLPTAEGLRTASGSATGASTPVVTLAPTPTARPLAGGGASTAETAMPALGMPLEAFAQRVRAASGASP